MSFFPCNEGNLESLTCLLEVISDKRREKNHSFHPHPPAHPLKTPQPTLSHRSLWSLESAAEHHSQDPQDAASSVSCAWRPAQEAGWRGVQKRLQQEAADMQPPPSCSSLFLGGAWASSPRDRQKQQTHFCPEGLSPGLVPPRRVPGRKHNIPETPGKPLSLP